MQDIIPKISNQLPFRGKFAFSEISQLSSDALEQLNKEEKQELEGFSNLRRQQEYISSRLILKRIGNHIGAKDLTILKDELGQPYGRAGSREYFVSIAHTPMKVFCGISQSSAIGVDLEPIARESTVDLKRRILHPDESQLFADLPIIRIWTIKEAFVKLRGKGLRLNMNQVHVQQAGEEFFVELNNDKRAKICSFQMDRNWLAVAYFDE